MTAYYNENDPAAAAWLRELITRGLICPGDVDERSIEEVNARDLERYTQCHFFAGIGVWSYALGNAGWPDDARVWTGSCPCQSFSASGKREGFDDKRHLWPAWFRLVDECRPDVIFGEQVASKDGLAWFDVVSSDLETAGYAVGAADMCAAGVGAPHIRQRLYFVADAGAGRLGAGQRHLCAQGRQSDAGGRGTFGIVAESDGGNASTEGLQRGGQHGQQPQDGGAGSVENTERNGRSRSEEQAGQKSGATLIDNGSEPGELGNTQRRGFGMRGTASGDSGRAAQPGFTNGYWRAAEWIYCRDEKYRPVEPGSFPLATGAPARVGRLRGYGNSIVAPCAQAFIEAWLEITTGVGSSE